MNNTITPTSLESYREPAYGSSKKQFSLGGSRTTVQPSSGCMGSVSSHVISNHLMQANNNSWLWQNQISVRHN